MKASVGTAHRNRGSAFQWLQAAMVCSAVLVAIPAMLTLGLLGKSATEKYLTTTAQPLFLICFGLLTVGLVLVKRQQRGAAWVIWTLSGCIWIVSSGIVRDEVYRRWERQIPTTPLDVLPTYDYVVVLGGGTGLRPDGSPQLSEAGDRAMLAARLYHRGLAKRLVTSGDTIRPSWNIGGQVQATDTPSNQTELLWQELGIPVHAIEKLGGENTMGEMQELGQRPEWWQDKKCGIITSAYHMPRAMRLAKQAGIKADPIPSHFRTPSKNRPFLPDNYLPKADKLADMHDLFKEWMARLVGR